MAAGAEEQLRLEHERLQRNLGAAIFIDSASGGRCHIDSKVSNVSESSSESPRRGSVCGALSAFEYLPIVQSSVLAILFYVLS
mmetsp:Transcript_40461/g.68996  ORF Transcript_40461/g.68996 Transcript_40461/m.68996 type:complete len:83 (+) Transcript_40461:100-348(+)